MTKAGKIINGANDVRVNGLRVARKGDLTDHGAMIAEGAEDVVAGGASRPVARMSDRFLCASSIGGPHVGGTIVAGSPNVVVGGRPAARERDSTLCLGPDHGAGKFDDLGAMTGLTDAAAAAECAALWAKYDQEAAAMIADAGDDHRKRNHIINGAYADLYHRNKEFAWAGLAAYASKQVGCAMDHSRKVSRETRNCVARDMADYTYEMLGKGNRDLFLDIYPMHRFYEEQGYERMKACASERPGGPVPTAALDGFAALDKYKNTNDPKYLEEHVRAIAFHEQVTVLQNGIYNDPKMQTILDLNEGALRDAGEGADDYPADTLTPRPFGPLEPRAQPDDSSDARKAGRKLKEMSPLPDDMTTPQPLAGERPAPPDARGVPEEVIRWGGGKPGDVVMSSECSDPTGKKTIRFKHGDRENLYDVDQRMEWILEDITEGYYLPNMGSKEHVEDIERLRDRGKQHGAVYPP